jgi:Subtilase family
MAGTIAGRMNNGVGVVGVAPNSRVLPILITQVEHGNLLRLSALASAIDTAGASAASIINISAKWPVDSRLVRESIERATGAGDTPRKLLVTGYTTSFAWDDTVTEGYPSRYRCMPGVIAAVPGDGRAETRSPNQTLPAQPQDGRIMAPGVDIVVTTTQNASSRYALAQAGGASSAAAYTSGALALIWGTPPLNQCGAREIKQLLFCRSKRTRESKYPWVQVDFLSELASLPGDATCADALSSLACN